MSKTVTLHEDVRLGKKKNPRSLQLPGFVVSFSASVI